jgi:hypothetical protein
VIPKMPELDEAHSELEWEGIGLDAPHGANGSTGMFLNKLKPRFVMSPTNLPFFSAGDDDVGASLHQITQGFMSVEVTDEDDKQIIDCVQITQETCKFLRALF